MLDSTSVKSADRTLAILSFLDGRPRPVTTMMIARALGLPRSSTYRLLNVMRTRRYIEYYSELKSWSLGTRARELGSGLSHEQHLVWLAQSVVTELSQCLSASAYLTVLDGGYVRFCHCKELQRPYHYEGSYLPAHLSAFGQAILMHASDRFLSALFPTNRQLQTLRAPGLATSTELRTTLARSRERGFAVEDSAIFPGLTSIAASVRARSGAAVAALGVSFPSQALLGTSVPTVGEVVRQAADQVSMKLGFERQLVEKPVRPGGRSLVCVA